MPSRGYHSGKSTIQVPVYFTDGLMDSLETYCKGVGKNRSEVIREAVTAYLLDRALEGRDEKRSA